MNNYFGTKKNHCMKHKLPVLFLFLFLLSIAPVSAQLRSELNLPRAGDDLMKEQVVYFEPGETGEKQTWNFSRIRLVDDAYMVHYFTRDDWKIIGSENEKLTFLKVTGDSLLLCGYETPTRLVKYNLQGLMLHFPIAYGRVSYGEFFGRGKYHDRFESVVSGEIRTEADATGRMILPGGDTLTHVIRVYMRKVERTAYLPVTSGFSFDSRADEARFSGAQTEVITTNTWQWYEEGYRYPVIETIEKFRDEPAGRRTVISRNAYFYHPAEQFYLPEDAANQVVLERKQSAQNAKMQEQEGNIVSFGCYPNPVKDILKIDLLLRKEATIQISILDMSGREIHRFPKRTHVVHDWETIDMHTYSPGYYVIKVSTGDETVSEKILKN